MTFFSQIKKKNIKPNYLDGISILCAFIIPLLVAGPFLPDLIISLLSLWFLYYSLKNKMYAIYQNPYFYVFISFCFICILSSILSDHVLLSLKSSLFYFRIGIFALLISYLIDQNTKILDYFYYSFLVTFSILALDGYIQYLTGSNLLGFTIQSNRVSSFFEDELILGSYLSRLSPLFFALFIARRNKSSFEVYGFFILYSLITILIFVSGERAAFALFILSFVFIILFLSDYKFLRIAAFVFSISIVSMIISSNDNFYNRFITAPFKNMALNDNNKKFLFFTPAHDSLIKTGLNMFLKKPILGHGPKSFRIKCQNPIYADDGAKPCDIHPHNFYIQLLAETGIIGFSFLAGLFFFFIYLILRQIKERFIHNQYWLTDYQICLLAGLLITIWPITTNGNIFTNNLMIFYSLQMGFFKKEL